MLPIVGAMQRHRTDLRGSALPYVRRVLGPTLASVGLGATAILVALASAWSLVTLAATVVIAIAVRADV